ncbi:MAG: hypothetical protein ABIJ91_04150 [Candidatus Kuenenbacteria bacterium]
MKLDKNFIQEIKTELLKEEAKLKEELADFTVYSNKGKKNEGNYTATFPDFGDKSGENASEVASHDNDLSLTKILKDNLKDIKDALARIKKGNYGVCKYCNKQIKPQRLKARPASASCVECKKSFTN